MLRDLTIETWRPEPAPCDLRQAGFRMQRGGATLRTPLTEGESLRLARAYRQAGGEAVEGFRKVLLGLIGRASAPCRPRRVARRPARRDDGRAGREKPHILVVDDDTRLRELLRRISSRNGFRVTVARDAADARQLLERSASTCSCSTS